MQYSDTLWPQGAGEAGQWPSCSRVALGRRGGRAKSSRVPKL